MVAIWLEPTALKARSAPWTSASRISPVRTALLPMSAAFTSPLTMSSEKTVFAA